MNSTRLPKKPAGWAFRNFLRFRRDPLRTLVDLERECGPAATFGVGPLRFVVLSDPELIKQLLVTQHRSFMKGRALQSTKRLLGEGLLTSEGEHHHRQRRLMQPVFHTQRIASYADCMARFANEAQAQWRDGAVLDVAEEMMRLTLRIVGKTLFNIDATEVADRVHHDMAVLMDWFPKAQLPFAAWFEELPLPPMRRMQAARADLDRLVLGMIAERRGTGRDEGDLLSMLLAAQEDGRGLTDQEVRDEALTLFLAGHETTANALAWTWYLLAQHPEIAARLHAELDTVLGDALPTFADVRRLPLTENVVTEAMRLYPPAWAVGRTALVDAQIGDYSIPKGSVVIASQYVMHRLPKYFTEPAAFRPERWTPEFRAALPKYAYFPFSGGPRQCIGEGFAWMELSLVIATIARHWKMEVEPGQTIALQPAVTLRPRNGIRLRLQRRERLAERPDPAGGGEAASAATADQGGVPRG
jgi:cytochrome P450